MSDLVGNPEDRFPCVAAHISLASATLVGKASFRRATLSCERSYSTTNVPFMTIFTIASLRMSLASFLPKAGFIEI